MSKMMVWNLLYWLKIFDILKIVLKAFEYYSWNAFFAFTVMLRAWRERDQEKRIKIAHQALEHNAKYVTTQCIYFILQCM